jgi:hypothetical protein
MAYAAGAIAENGEIRFTNCEADIAPIRRNFPQRSQSTTRTRASVALRSFLYIVSLYFNDWLT